jgi:hypothetical protein
VELVFASVVLALSNDLLKAKVTREPLLTADRSPSPVLMAFGTTMMPPIILFFA